MRAVVGVVLTTLLVLVIAWIVIKGILGVQVVECVDDHRAWGSPALQVGVQSQRPVGRVTEYELPLDCSAYTYSVPSRGPLRGD